MSQASRRVFVVGAFFCHTQSSRKESAPVALRSLSQLHSSRDRHDGVLRLAVESGCLSIGLRLAAKPKQPGFRVDQRSEQTLAIATDAVSNPTTRAPQPGGNAEAGTRQGHTGS